ncbi:MAG: lipopolysaccharide biosynthesis protein [Thermoanaerobaculia bacterium]
MLVAHGVAALLAFAWSVVAARILGPAGFGDYSTAVLIATVLAAFWPFGLITAQLSARFAARKQWPKIAGLLRLARRTLLPAAAVVALALGAVLVLLRDPLHYRSPLPLFAAAGLWLALAVVTIPKNAIRALGLWTSYSWFAALEPGLRLAAGAAVLAVLPTPAAAVCAWAAASAVIAVAAGRILPRHLPAPAAVRLDPRRLWSLAAPAVLILTLSTSWQFFDLLIVRWRFGAEPSGVFGAAHTLARTILVLGMTLDVLFVPLLSRAGLRGTEAARTVARLFGTYALVALPLLAILAFAARPVVSILFGSTYLAAAPIAFPLAVATFFTYGSAVVAQGLLAVHAFRAPLVWAGFFAVALIMMTLAPGPLEIAWIGAALSGSAFTAMLVLLFRRLRRS